MATGVNFFSGNTYMSIEQVVRTLPQGNTQSTKEATKESGTSFADTLNQATASQYTNEELDKIFSKASDTYGVSLDLLKAVAKAESNFDPNCVSSAGAQGVMQLMPETAKELGVTNPFDAEQNIMGGAKCLSDKLDEFNGDISLALAAYNAGSGSVNKYGGIPPYTETQNYVEKILGYLSNG